jgi:hypothetical protein
MLLGMDYLSKYRANLDLEKLTAMIRLFGGEVLDIPSG